ncbi:uncharacterized protein K452DRAFT_193845, partial [Aplosporella prunicola CBS 121167]
MRFLALVPVLCTIASLVLGFLCIFAGTKQDGSFMESYNILTLNTSRLGQDYISDSASSWLSSLYHNATSSIASSLNSDLNSLISDVSADLGIQNFYSAHLMTYCSGSYTPTSVANASVPDSAIHKNVSHCSAQKAMFYFDPTAALERSLNNSEIAQRLNIKLADLDWPDDIEDGLRALRIAWKAAFVLYCVGVALAAVSFLASVVAFFMAGRLSAVVNILLAILAFLALALASAVTTAVAVKGSSVVNDKGKEIGLRAERGGKFMAITWAATAAMFVALLVWCVDCCLGRR